MADFWDQTIYLLETLVMKAKGQDKDGMDLSFTNGPVHLKNGKGPSGFREKMEDPKARPYHSVHTEMGKALGKIMAEYLQSVKSWKSSIKTTLMKKLTVIVLTDGVWANMENQQYTVIQRIVSFHEDLSSELQETMRQDRHVSFEFVQLGNDIGARQLLKYLDDELTAYGIE